VTTRLSFKTGSHATDWPSLLAVWRRGDEVERLHAGWVNDHLYNPFYPKGSDTTRCFEAFTLLAALAAETRRVRLGTMVAANLFRHPAVLVKMAITVDHVSDGRFELGIGAGWHEEEHADHGLPLHPVGERVDAFEEAVEIVTSLLHNETTSFEGNHYRLAGAKTDPPSVQSRLPLLIGGSKPRMLRIVARHADHWNVDGSDPQVFSEALSGLQKACDDVGRDPSEIEKSAQFWIGSDIVKARVKGEALVEAGAEHLILSFISATPDLLSETVEALADL
jgi:alkanesulfonate monooxygenase SsuD/methylene tetrahydromethanopterin reductase-like flavin-dependent oxidoreductase (luciferase family)